MANLFKSLNISQPADQNTIEGYLSTLGGQTKFPLASNVKQSELVQDQLNRLKELRIADLPLDIAAQVPAYDKAQMPPQEELDMRLRRNLGIADPQLVQQLKLLYEDELKRALEEDGSPSSSFITPKTYYPNV